LAARRRELLVEPLHDYPRDSISVLLYHQATSQRTGDIAIEQQFWFIRAQRRELDRRLSRFAFLPERAFGYRARKSRGSAAQELICKRSMVKSPLYGPSLPPSKTT
jgi:hypothetical protein